jgi:hypothetical protein
LTLTACDHHPAERWTACSGLHPSVSSVGVASEDIRNREARPRHEPLGERDSISQSHEARLRMHDDILRRVWIIELALVPRSLESYLVADRKMRRLNVGLGPIETARYRPQ